MCALPSLQHALSTMMEASTSMFLMISPLGSWWLCLVALSSSSIYLHDFLLISCVFSVPIHSAIGITLSFIFSSRSSSRSTSSNTTSFSLTPFQVVRPYFVETLPSSRLSHKETQAVLFLISLSKSFLPTVHRCHDSPLYPSILTIPFSRHLSSAHMTLKPFFMTFRSFLRQLQYLPQHLLNKWFPLDFLRFLDGLRDSETVDRLLL